LAKWGNAARREDRPKQYFPIKSPEEKNIYPTAPDGNDGRWRVGKKRMDLLLENNLIDWQQKKGTWIPYEKVYYDENSVKVIKERSVIYDLINTADATKRPLHKALNF
jgi:adenine-specific DNA-methyltransferase